MNEMELMKEMIRQIGTQGYFEGTIERPVTHGGDIEMRVFPDEGRLKMQIIMDLCIPNIEGFGLVLDRKRFES